jgi:hypothetical protein
VGGLAYRTPLLQHQVLAIVLYVTSSDKTVCSFCGRHALASWGSVKICPSLAFHAPVLMATCLFPRRASLFICFCETVCGLLACLSSLLDFLNYITKLKIVFVILFIEWDVRIAFLKSKWVAYFIPPPNHSNYNEANKI